MGCGDRPPCGSRGGGPDCRPFARASASHFERKVVAMRKLKPQKGFTLAELLIVVAIIAVLVAVAVPVFSAQLEKSREAVDMANARAANSMAMADYLTNHSNIQKIEYIFAIDKNNNLEIVFCSESQYSESSGKKCTIPEHNIFWNHDTWNPDSDSWRNYYFAQSKKCQENSISDFLRIIIEDGKITSNNWLEVLG